MIYYFINIIFFVWMLTSIWYSDNGVSLFEISDEIANLRLVYGNSFYISFFWVFFMFCTHFVLHFILGIRSGISVFDYFGHLFISLAVFLFTIIPISFSIFIGVLGKRIIFIPSNLATHKMSIYKLILPMIFLWLSSFVALLQYFWNHESPWAHLGGLWAILIFIAPMYLFFAHRYQLSGENYAKFTKQTT